MNKQNYHAKMMELIKEHCKDGKVPTLLLHSCCAPCSSYCLELLSGSFPAFSNDSFDYSYFTPFVNRPLGL